VFAIAANIGGGRGGKHFSWRRGASRFEVSRQGCGEPTSMIEHDDSADEQTRGRIVEP